MSQETKRRGLETEQLVTSEGEEEEWDADDKGRKQQKLGDDDYSTDENEAESETDKQVVPAE